MRKKRMAAAGGCAVFLAALAAVGMMQTKGGSGMEEIREYHNELFGENVYLFSPEDDLQEVARVLGEIYDRQEEDQFGEERCAVCFLPGVYEEPIEVQVGFYTQVSGLGELPTDTRIPSLQCTARWLGDDPSNHNACQNFWRGVENLELGSNTMWAVSQATFLRRVQVDGALYLHDEYGWCSGGFLADSNIELMTDSGSQQQWLSRNCSWKAWMGANWNMVFAGIEEGEAPVGTWPAVPYTTIAQTDWIQEKPFLIYDDDAGYQVFVPQVRTAASGTSWEDGAAGEKLPISEFYVAKEGDTAGTMNAALREGKHLLLTPGVYELSEPLRVERAGTIVLGMGLATLRPLGGHACMETADAPGLIIAGLLFDAGTERTEDLLVVGAPQTMPSGAGESRENIALSDLFFRVGGAPAGRPAVAKRCLTIESSHVVGDNFWVWRADHGEQVAWDGNVSDTGLVVNGDDVTIYALMVEHFERYQTVWNGERGKVYLYQSEIPYDVPSQEAWMSHDGTREGYASFRVDDDVREFEAWGLGIYLYNRDAPVTLFTAMEVPDRPGVRIHHICTVMLNGHPGMEHIVNDQGGAVGSITAREIICEYEDGIVK